MEREAVRNVWNIPFRDFLNEEKEKNSEEEPVSEGPIEGVTSDEVRAAIKGLKNKKASGPSGTTSDIFKYAGEIGGAKLYKILQGIFLVRDVQ